MTVVLTNGMNLCYVITHNIIWTNQKSELPFGIGQISVSLATCTYIVWCQLRYQQNARNDVPCSKIAWEQITSNIASACNQLYTNDVVFWLAKMMLYIMSWITHHAYLASCRARVQLHSKGLRLLWQPADKVTQPHYVVTVVVHWVT